MKFNQPPANNKEQISPSVVAETQPVILDNVLPMDRSRDSVMEMIDNNKTVIVVGETGSGKTTRTPIYLMEQYPDKKIAVTSPRVLPARSVSRYVAQQKGGLVGGEIGLITREKREVGEDTRVTFMTDGILLNMLRKDPMLLDLDIVMVDEAHERSLNIDLGLGLLKQAQRLRKEKGKSELKIVVASATIEEQKFADYFESSPVAKVEGRLFPVDLEYRGVPDGDDYTVKAGLIVKEIINNNEEGDILVFMPGEEEINKTVDSINSLISSETVNVLPLFGAMNPQDQDRIFAKNGKRKVIVSTNIAETSVTIDGVKHVIDAGLLKQKEYNPDTGIDALTLSKASQANLNQRMGRAGRTSPGKCYRLISKSDFESRDAFQKPEILRFDLGEIVLKMKDMGIKDVEGFDFIDNPSKARIHDAVTNLTRLGALDKNGDITEIGQEMVRLQLRPDLARMLIEAKHLDCLTEMIDICAMMSASKQVFVRPRRTDNQSETAENYRKTMNQNTLKIDDSDVLTLLNVWKKWEESRFNNGFAFEHLLNIKALKEVGLTRMQLLRALGEGGTNVENGDKEIDKTKIVKCLLAGMPDSIFFSNDNGYHYGPVADLPYLNGAQIFPGSVLFKRGGDLILAMNINKSEKEISNSWGGTFKKETLYARVCHKITLDEIKEALPGSVTESKSGEPQQRYGGDSYYQIYNILINGKFIKQESREIEMGMMSQDVLLLLPDIYRSNENVFNNYKDLCIRSGGEFAVPERDYLRNFYDKVISENNITNDEELVANVDKLQLYIDDLISAEKEEEIERDSPKEVIIGWKTFKVNYSPVSMYRDNAGYYASINLDGVGDARQVLGHEMPEFKRMKRFVYRYNFYKDFDNLNDLEEYVESLSVNTSNRISMYGGSSTYPSVDNYSKDTAPKATLGDILKRAQNSISKTNENTTPNTSTEVKPKVEQKPVEKEIMTPEKKEKILSSVQDIKSLISSLRGIINALPDNKEKDQKAKKNYLEKIKDLNSRCNNLSKSVSDDVEKDVERINGIIVDIKSSIKSIIKNVTENKQLAEKLVDSFVSNKEKLVASAKNNDVEITEELLGKISDTSFKLAFKDEKTLTEIDADEILIDLV